MEELKSTEALDREILEDARKKAYRILKTADETKAAQKLIWEKKTKESVDSIRQAYGEKIKKTGDEILARLPLDKRRLRCETAEALLVKAMDDFLGSLERGQLLSVLEKELYRRLEFYAASEQEGAASEQEGGETAREAVSGADEKKPEVVYSGLTSAETQTLVKKAAGAFPGLKLINKASGFSYREERYGGVFPSIVIDVPALKISCSVEKAAAMLLKDNRSELASALLGEGVLDD